MDVPLITETEVLRKEKLRRQRNHSLLLNAYLWWTSGDFFAFLGGFTSVASGRQVVSRKPGREEPFRVGSVGRSHRDL